MNLPLKFSTEYLWKMKLEGYSIKCHILNILGGITNNLNQGLVENLFFRVDFIN